MDYPSDVRRGMAVYAADGKKLGQVVDKGTDRFLIEKGLFFPKDYECGYDKIASLSADEVHLSIAGDALIAGKAVPEAAAPTRREAGEAPEARAAKAATGIKEETRIPLAEEQLEASRRGYEAGEVRVHKEVQTKTAEVSVPLRHEEVTVERVPVESREAKPGEASFEKSTTTVPIYEEEAEIRKRPVVREEVRVSKERFQEERRAAEEVRKETAEVEKSGDIEEEPTRK